LTLQSALLLQLHNLTYFKLFEMLGGCADRPDFNNYNVLVLDILHLILRAVKPSDLIMNQDRVGPCPFPADWQAPMDKLAKLLDLETRQKSLQSRQGTTRHSRFGTTVSVQAVRGLSGDADNQGDQKLVLHRQNAINFDAGKLLDQGKKKKAGRAKKAVGVGYCQS
jgi:replication fork protection complex subunit Tof1/Swi1